MNGKFRFYVELFIVAANIGFVIDEIPYCLITHTTPPPFLLALFTFNWVMMIMYNGTWHDLLEKWKGGGKR